MLTSTYGSDIYVIAAYFDPRFKFQWVESCVKLNQEQLQTLVAELNIIVRSFVESTNAFYKRVTSSSAKDAGASTSSTADAGCEPPPTKKSKLFATCTTVKSNSTGTTLASVAAQMNNTVRSSVSTTHRLTASLSGKNTANYWTNYIFLQSEL